LWSIHNSIELKKQGLPTTLVCSSNFTALVKATAKAKGHPDLKTLVVPHPIAEVDPDAIRRKAEAALEELVALFGAEPG
jgi:hypothetical protein